MKNYFIFIFSLLAFNANAQEYRWTGNSNNNDFFDELNWVEFISNNIPAENSINPGQPIGFSLYLTCEIVADGEIILNENGKIIITDGELNSGRHKIIGGGKLVVYDSINSDEKWVNIGLIHPDLSEPGNEFLLDGINCKIFTNW